MPIAIEIKVYGRVQGVGYRYFIKQKAEEIGIKGWVKNKADGSVEILAQGEPEKIENFINYCERGTSYSSVEHVNTQEVPLSENNSFKIKI